VAAGAPVTAPSAAAYVTPERRRRRARRQTRLGLMLGWYRRRAAISQADVARSAGVTVAVVRALEAGSAATHPGNLAKISQWLLQEAPPLTPFQAEVFR